MIIDAQYMHNGYDIAKNSPAFRKIEVSSVLFSEYKCLEERSIFTAWTHVNHFVYVLQGKKQWRTMMENYMVHAHEVIFVKKGANIIHKYFDTDFCALVIFIPDAFIRGLLTEKPSLCHLHKGNTGDSVIPLKIDRTLRTYFKSLLAYFYSEARPSTHLMELKFKELLINILTGPNHPEIGSYLVNIAQDSKPALRSIMETNFTYNLSIKEFARLTHRSVSTFNRDFYNLYRMSPGKWLSEKRLQHAKRLLESTDHKIYEIAYDCGFENPSHFIRSFKNLHGISPLKFRKTQVTP